MPRGARRSRRGAIRFQIGDVEAVISHRRFRHRRFRTDDFAPTISHRRFRTDDYGSDDFGTDDFRTDDFRTDDAAMPPRKERLR
ncbi:hypothetical protein FX016_01545 [Cupriavidus gilardii]|nr:hypothetical protein FX016_01545 [Cupriavidus gilardii]